MMSTLNNFTLDGKIALVTGCKHGFGVAIAIGLADAGVDIIGASTTFAEESSDEHPRQTQTRR